MYFHIEIKLIGETMMNKQRTAKKLINLALALILFALVPAISLGAEDDFVIKDGVLIKYNGTDTEIIIPDDVTSIGEWAFGNYQIFKSGALGPNNPHSKFITSIIIPDSVEILGGYVFDVFYGCQSLTAITVGENNSNYLSIDGVLFSKDKTELIKYPIAKSETSYDIPNGVIYIARDAFYDCKNLTNINFPDGLKEIGDYAFEHCESLTSVVLPDSVKSIGYLVFNGCNSLISIVMNNVTIIGYGAFHGCDNLTIHARSGSYAERYAKYNKIKFEELQYE